MTMPWKEFTAGFREGCRPFRMVIPQLLAYLALSTAILALGVGAIVLSETMTEPGARVMVILGKGALVGGAVLGAVATLRAWRDLFKAIGLWGNAGE